MPREDWDTRTISADSPADNERLLDEYVGKRELAREFGVSKRTIERWVRLRLLPAPVRLGRTALYHIPTLKRHLADQVNGERRLAGLNLRRPRVNR